MHISQLSGSSLQAQPHASIKGLPRSRAPLQIASAFNFKFPQLGMLGKQQKQLPGAVEDILAVVQGTERGLATTKQGRLQVDAAVEELERLSETEGQAPTTGNGLSATWKLMWSTEKETLFILRIAPRFGTEAGDVLQVIDLEEQRLQNVITFPPEGSFVVDSAISVAGPRRVDFQFTSASLALPSRTLRLPPFGKGWFDNLYVGPKYRVARDVRGDVLVCERDGAPRMSEV